MTTNATGADKPGSGPEQVARSLPPIPLISPYLALRVGARVLDPTTAPLAPDQTAPSPTVYLADSLLIPSTDPQSLSTTFVALRKHAQDHGICLELESLGRSSDPRTLSLARTSQRLRLCSTKRQSAPPIDAWEYLQTALADGVVPMRTQSNADRTSPAVTLEHLLTAAGGAWGATGGAWGATGGAWGATGGAWGATGGAWGATGGAWGATGLAEYGSPGLGGRTPVTWSGRNPRHGMSTTGRPPVVAILDTGIGTSHPWFSDGDGVHRNIAHQGTRIGLFHDAASDPEATGVIIDPVNGLVDPLCGHGTFVAGIIRQRCPQAELLSIPVLLSDGAAREGDVLQALELLLARHLDGQAGALTDDPFAVLDFVNLSVGYYHETPPDAQDSQLQDVVRRLAEAGVSVVAAAGNNATTTEFFPAAFTSTVPGMTSVGAQNPDGATVAMFSNSGTWVTTHAPGTAIVSTVPTTLSGSWGRSMSVDGVAPATRATVDPDDYRSGFAIWSGTSFAAPYVVGEAAARLLEGTVERSEAAVPWNAIDATKAVAAELTTNLKDGT